MRRREIRTLHRRRIITELGKRRGETFGITREQSTRRIGEIFATARDRELDEFRGDGREDDADNRENEENNVYL